MKLQLPVWVALTVLMVFLVLAAAFVFLFQGRQELLRRSAALEATLTVAGQTVEDLALDATVQAGAAADSAATRASLAAQPTATPTPPPPTPTPAPPAVAVFKPADGTVVRPNRDLDLLVSVSDPLGIASIVIRVNDAVWKEIAVEGQLLYTVQETWRSAQEGEFRFTVTAVGRSGQTGAPVTVDVSVVDVEGRLSDLIAAIQRNVEELRGLTFGEPITLTLLTTDELRVRVEQDFFAEVTPEDARTDVIELHAFDFVALDFDLYDTLLRLYSGSILGFYDLDTGELVVVSDDAELSPYEQLTLAHEITHALQARNFAFRNDDGLDSEAAYALRALAEGDATLLQTLYLGAGYFTQREINALMRELSAESTAEFADIPDIIMRQQMFPYEEGFNFVRALYETGGFAAVDAAWRNPPTTTEHILHPERYLAGDAPILVALPPLTATLGAGWELIDEDILGEFYVREYLDQLLPTSAATRAGTGWGGDRYAVYWNEADGQLVMTLRAVWDDVDEAAEFAAVFASFAARRYPGPVGPAAADGPSCWAGGDVMCLYLDGDETLLVRAPSTAVVTAVADTVARSR